MANDDRQSEHFIREVDEELRRAQLKALWDRFAPLIIGVCIAVVALTAGYRGYLWWQERQAAEAGDRYMAALAALEAGDAADGEAALNAIAAEGTGAYPALARLRLAGAQATAGNREEARQAYDDLTMDSAVPRAMRDLARIRAAMLALDLRDFAGATERAEPLNVPGNNWRHTAREILGTAAYASGDLERARDIFGEIQQDAETPQDVWVRSGLMMSLINGRLRADTVVESPQGSGETVPTGAQVPAAPAGEEAPEAPLAKPGQPAVESGEDLGTEASDSTAPNPPPESAIPPQ
jgi:hypothetical protein